MAASFALMVRAMASRSGALWWAALGVFLIGAWTQVASGIEAVLWLSLASQALVIRALMRHSWVMMWLAALGSFVFSILSMFSIGAYVFLLTCVQLAVVVALRLHASLLQEVAIIFIGILAWVLIVLAQMVGVAWIGGFGMYQLAGFVGLVLVVLPVSGVRSAFAPGKSLRLS